MTFPTRDRTRPKATVFCEGNFAQIDGKTANGLVRHSEKYEILVGDRQHAGRRRRRRAARRNPQRDPDLSPTSTTALRDAGRVPDFLIFGVAPTSGLLSPPSVRSCSTRSIGACTSSTGCTSSSTTTSSSPPPRPRTASTILDVRRPARRRRISACSPGASTRSPARASRCSAPTARSASARPRRSSPTRSSRPAIRAVLVGTGQTGLIQGARYGVALDAIPAQFCSGEMEAAVVDAFEGEHPDVIIVEGQGALSHPAYLSSTFDPARQPPCRAWCCSTHRRG